MSDFFSMKMGDSFLTKKKKTRKSYQKLLDAFENQTIVEKVQPLPFWEMND